MKTDQAVMSIFSVRITFCLYDESFCKRYFFRCGEL